MVALVSRDDGSAELKRMFVDAAARGQGLAGNLLAAVEEPARDAGARVIQLETRPEMTAAIALYTKHGYRQIPNFGPYIGGQHSFCMEKSL